MPQTTNLLGSRFRLRNDRQAKALTGCSVVELEELLPVFEQFLTLHYQTLKATRQRGLGGGKKGALPLPADKLIAVLMYLKTYPTYDVFSLVLDLDRTRCFRWVQILLPLLEASLGRKLVLPKRKITSIEEFYRCFPDAKDVLVDGTERPIQRPKDQKKRKKVYSGKKKTTTRKHIVIANPKRRILILGKSKTGRRHDKRITERQQHLDTIPPDVTAWMDSGFSGAQALHANSQISAKATKNHPLTKAQKQHNKIVGAFRIPVEHAIGGMKRMNAAADIWRNRIPGLDDQVMLISAGLWNLHLDVKERTDLNRQLQLQATQPTG